MNQWKFTDLTGKNILFTDESVKRQITDWISENLTNSELESIYFTAFLEKYSVAVKRFNGGM